VYSDGEDQQQITVLLTAATKGPTPPLIVEEKHINDSGKT
jgi:hypothetical protein